VAARKISEHRCGVEHNELFTTFHPTDHRHSPSGNREYNGIYVTEWTRSQAVARFADRAAPQQTI